MSEFGLMATDPWRQTLRLAVICPVSALEADGCGNDAGVWRPHQVIVHLSDVHL
jgi:hypothetical protein